MVVTYSITVCIPGTLYNAHHIIRVRIYIHKYSWYGMSPEQHQSWCNNGDGGALLVSQEIIFPGTQQQYRWNTHYPLPDLAYQAEVPRCHHCCHSLILVLRAGPISIRMHAVFGRMSSAKRGDSRLLIVQPPVRTPDKYI